MDATAGHTLLRFMDTLSGYHQIPLCPEEQEKAVFVTDKDLHCYKVTPFGLKNVEATYQRLVSKLFELLFGRTMEVYVDDMISKNMLDREQDQDPRKTFDILRTFCMKFNLKKCVFDIRSGKLLGFMVSSHGIEANPDKIQVVLDMKPPFNIKVV